MCVKRARQEAKAAETAVRGGEDLPLLHGLPDAELLAVVPAGGAATGDVLEALPL
jgi:hypothetical protein